MTYKQIIKKLEKDYGWSNTKTFNAIHQELIKNVSKIVCGQLDAQVKQLLADNEEMNLLFEMQNKRMREADKYWQKLTGKKNTYPDLGRLLFFLMDRIKELESKQSV